MQEFVTILQTGETPWTQTQPCSHQHLTTTNGNSHAGNTHWYWKTPWSIFLPRFGYSGIEFILSFPDDPVVLWLCLPTEHPPGMGWALAALIQENSNLLENRDWHNGLYLANSSFKIHSFHLFGYETAARQKNRNHQWKFFLQEADDVIDHEIENSC